MEPLQCLKRLTSSQQTTALLMFICNMVIKSVNTHTHIHTHKQSLEPANCSPIIVLHQARLCTCRLCTLFFSKYKFMVLSWLGLCPQSSNTEHHVCTERTEQSTVNQTESMKESELEICLSCQPCHYMLKSEDNLQQSKLSLIRHQHTWRYIWRSDLVPMSTVISFNFETVRK